MKNEILNILYTYWPAISAAILEIVLRLWPTTKNYSIIDLTLKLAGYVLQITQKGTEKIIPNRMKNTLKFILILFLFSFTANAQLNGNFKTVRLTTGITQSDTTTKAVNGQLYYNHNTNKFRARQNNTWINLIGGGSGLTTASTGLTAVGSDVRLGGVLNTTATISGASGVLDFTIANVRFNSDQLNIFNPARTFRYIFTGGAITANRFMILPLLTNNDTFVFANVSQTLTSKALSTGTSFPAIPTINDGITFTFNPSNTVSGLNVGANATNPTTPVNGDIYYNSSENALKFVAFGLNGSTLFIPDNGATINVGTSNTTGASRTFVATGSSATINLELAGKGSGGAIQLAPSGTSILSITNNAGNASFNATSGITLTPAVSSFLRIQNLPLNCTGAPSGAIYNDAGTLKICP